MSDLYDLPNGWKWEKLGDITELITKGTTPTTNGYKFQNSGINFLKIENIVKGEIDLSTIEMYISEEAHQSQKRSQLKENDVLFSIAGTIGDTAIVKKEHLPMNTNQAIALIRPKDILSSFFLRYSLTSIISQNTKDKQRGGAIKNISLGDIKELMYPLPPLSEQQRIVSKLDNLFEKIDKSIALHQKNMDEADVFMGSILNNLFRELEEKYEVQLLGNLTKTTSGGTPKRNEKSYWGGNIGWLKSGELNDGYITEVEEFITEDGLNKSSAKLFPIGTLLIAMYGATVGRLGILEIETTTNQAVCGILNDKNQFETLYMFYFLKKIREKMLKDSFGGAQPNISQTYIKELEVPLPPLNIQQKVVKYLDEVSEKIEKVKSIQKVKMDSLKALKASILDKAFRGEL
ncbi:MAG: restriction endonuclease subunit S [Sulfurimonadaceae bacterium]